MSEPKENKQSSPTGDTASVATVPATPVVAIDPRIVDLLMEDRAEQALERKQQREHNAKKAQLRREGAADAAKNTVETIQACCIAGHQKGGRTRRRNALTDRLVGLHRFISGEYRVHFMCCNFSLWGPRQGGKIPADTREIVWVDKGNGYEKFVNPSFNPARSLPGISYEDALLMTKNDTSNVFSSSETIPLATPAAQELEKENAELKAKLAAMLEKVDAA
jgi:hypothetical protein